MRHISTSITRVLIIGALLCIVVSTNVFAALGNNTIYLPLTQSAQATTPTPSLPPIVASARWSDPSTWSNGQVPGAGAEVVIPDGKNVLLDVSPPALKSLMIEGALVFDRKDLTLDAGWIMLHSGALAIGSEQQPFTHRATITLTASDLSENVMGMGTRGIMLMGESRLDLFGSTPQVTWTQLDNHASAGATQLTLKEAVNWRAGDQIVVAPTDFFAVAATERLEVSAISGANVTLRSGLQKARWGKLQYISSSGMTLAPDTSQTSLVLDERAEVGNLSRNIVIQGADDTLWREQSFGGFVMAMEGSTMRIDGVELRRVGQAGRIGRYPVHFHGLSYRSDGTVLKDATGQFVRNSAVWNSKNRCLVVHGTNGVSLTNNICYDILGHAVFFEDAVERRNTVERNLVLKVRNPPQDKQLLKHEGDIFSGGSSGFWITHPDNTLKGNVAADTEGNGVWYAFPKKPLGLFKNVQMWPPRNTPFGAFDDNVTHSNKVFGYQMDWVPTNDAGDISPESYRPDPNGQEPQGVTASLPYTIRRLTSYKNNGGATWHREGGAIMESFVAADNPGRQFAGSANCVIQNSISIGNSLNSATPIPTDMPPVGMASYHSSCDIKRHLFVNLPVVPGKASGVLDTSDYYIRPVDKGLFRDTDLRFINSQFGYRQPPFLNENWTLAGALWDPYGYVGPKNNYWVFDDPFLTAGTTCQDVTPAGKTGKSCAGPYYGLQGFILDQGNESWGALMPIEVTRDNGAKWTVGDGATAPKLGNMRHAALVKGGTFTLRFPQNPAPRNIEFHVENMLKADDWAVVGVHFDGSVNNPVVYGTTWHKPQEVRSWSDKATSPRVRLMQPASSIEEVRSSNGDKYYQDKANNMVYIKLRHDLPQGFTPEPGSDDDLYRAINFVIAAP